MHVSAMATFNAMCRLFGTSPDFQEAQAQGNEFGGGKLVGFADLCGGPCELEVNWSEYGESFAGWLLLAVAPEYWCFTQPYFSTYWFLFQLSARRKWRVIWAVSGHSEQRALELNVPLGV